MSFNDKTVKKSLGQHWLRDLDTLTAIVDAAVVQATDYILEIGPGQGTLTSVLIDRGAEVLALEFDHDLIGPLQAKFANCKKLAICFGDIRSYDYSKLPKNYKIVANIPYYLTSYLIRSISGTINPPKLAVLLVQKEVAERLCADPGKMGILSVTAQFYFECSSGLDVPARLFSPPPKVDSSVVVLKRRNKPLFNVDSQKFFRLVKMGFSNKRKTLKNSLSAGLKLSKDETEILLSKASISSDVRAQELSLLEWYDLYQVYEQETIIRG